MSLPQHLQEWITQTDTIALSLAHTHYHSSFFASMTPIAQLLQKKNLKNAIKLVFVELDSKNKQEYRILQKKKIAIPLHFMDSVWRISRDILNATLYFEYYQEKLFCIIISLNPLYVKYNPRCIHT